MLVCQYIVQVGFLSSRSSWCGAGVCFNQTRSVFWTRLTSAPESFSPFPATAMANPLGASTNEDVEMQDTPAPSQDPAAARPDAVSLREAALRTMKRKPRAPAGEAPAEAKRPRVAGRPAAAPGVQLDYGVGEGAPAAREEGEIEEGEVTPPNTPAPLPPLPQAAAAPVPPRAKPTVPLLDMAAYGVDATHVRPGVKSTPRTRRASRSMAHGMQ
jgi:hypothetical protein